MKSPCSKALSLILAVSLCLPVPVIAQEDNQTAAPSPSDPSTHVLSTPETTEALPEDDKGATDELAPESPATSLEPEVTPLVPAVVDEPYDPSAPSGPESPAEPQTPDTPDTPEEPAKPSGWVYENGWKWYDANGVAATGLKDIDGERYLFDQAGVMQTGWQWIEGQWYHFNPLADGFQGRMTKGWLYDGGIWYHFDLETGTMDRGWRWISGCWYAFLHSGEMQVGWHYLDNSWYYFNPGGDMRTGWLCDNGTWYAFASSGAMLKGRHTVDGLLSCFDSDGACTKTGWQNPAALYQVSARNVPPVRADKGIFSYMSPSRVSLDMTRTQCLDTFIGRALEYAGTPYVWDYACAPGVGVDCAGLVMQALYSIGVKTPYDPWLHWTDPWQDHNANNMYADSQFMWVNEGDVQRGDLVFYPGHVAIVLAQDLCIEAWPNKGVILSSITKSPKGETRIPTGYRRVCV